MQMGVRGLTTYVSTLPFGEGKVWESFDLQDTNLVIDGHGLYYYIYDYFNHDNQLNIKYGGEYNELQEKIKEFFAKLRSNNVVPYVVLDGIMTRDRKKLRTHIERNTQRIERMKNLWSSNGHDMVLPRLTQLAVVQVLQEIEVPYAVADFEADCEIASLANKLDAPVMASDSDFYIFDIKHGYIPFQQYSISGSNTTVKRFSLSGFAKHLGIDPSMLPLLASLVGNDYISDEMLGPFAKTIGSKDCVTIAQFLSRYNSILEAIHAVIGLYSNDDDKSAFEKVLLQSIQEYQMKQSNLIGYFDSGHLSCNMRTYINKHSLPQWIVKLYREGLIASEGLDCLCNRKIFLRTQCEDISLPSAQTCAQGLRWHYYALALNCEDTVVVPSATELPSQSKDSIPSVVPHGQIELGADFDHIPTRGLAPESQVRRDNEGNDTSPSTSYSTEVKDSEYSILESEFAHKLNLFTPPQYSFDNTIKDVKFGKTDKTRQVTSDLVKNVATVKDIIEFDRKGSRLGKRKVDLTGEVLEIKIEIHDIPQMSDQAKKSHLLNLLHSDQPFIHDLPIKHQLVMSALRYWVIHAQVKPAHLAALLVHYVGEKSDEGKFFQISLEAVHGFSQWQNVLYWVERLNALFSSTFPQLQVAELYNGVRVCRLYERLRVDGYKFAESIVTNANLYRHLYDVTTKNLPRDCQLNQSRSSQRQQAKRKTAR